MKSIKLLLTALIIALLSLLCFLPGCTSNQPYSTSNVNNNGTQTPVAIPVTALPASPTTAAATPTAAPVTATPAPATPATITPVLPTATREGVRLFAANCASCHGALPSDSWRVNLTTAQLTDKINTGGAKMPVFSGRLTPAQISAIVQYIHNRKTDLLIKIRH